MRIDDPHYQSIMKDLLNNKNPFYFVDFADCEYVRTKVGKYLGTSFCNCPCFEYEGKVLMLLTNFPIFGGWIIRPREEFDIKDDIPLKFARYHE